MLQDSTSINLLKEKEENFVDKFIAWALNVGRVVVIITELVALSAFLYRFSLDRQLIDLHDEISQKQAVVKLLKQNEDLYRSLHERLRLASKLTETSARSSDLLSDVIGLSPSGFIINDLVLSNETIKIDASAQSVSSLANFVQGIRTYEEINSVSLDRIENKISSGTIDVGITARLKKELNPDLNRPIRSRER